MKKFTKPVDELLQTMFLLGRGEDIKFGKKQKVVLSKLGIDDVTASDCKLTLTIANPKWSQKAPGGGFEYKIKHTGISAQFDY